MAADTALATIGGASARRYWLGAVIALTLVPFVLVVALAPAGSAPAGPALAWLLFTGSSVHVAATGWFYSVREVRVHMARHRRRYLVAPLALILGLAIVLPAVPGTAIDAVLLVFFAWQFFHFQKQNLGVSALAARASHVVGLNRTERRALTAVGMGGVVGLVGRPELLELTGVAGRDWVFWSGLAVFAAGAATGITCLARRVPRDRPAAFVVVQLSSLLFFLPVFVFASPYAAVAGLTIAHGLQYLLLIGLLAGARAPGRSVVGLLVVVNALLVLAIVLNQASHLHDSEGIGRAVFGAYLGLVCAHFVVDAGLWRLRDEFPRTFLAARLPYLFEARA